MGPIRKFILEKYSYSDDGVLFRLADNHKVHVPNKESKVLRSLIRHSGSVVTKQVLMKESWGHMEVSDESLTRCIYSLRKALSHNGKDFIETVYGRGYLLRSAKDVQQEELKKKNVGVLIYPFDCNNPMELQHSLIKSLINECGVNLYPGSLVDYEKIIPSNNDTFLKVMGGRVSSDKMRVDLIDGKNNYLIDTEMVKNDFQSILATLCNFLPKHQDRQEYL